jgi:hypothetical protein
MTPSNLKPSKPEGENLQMACMHSKFLVHQLLESLSLAAHQSIKQFKKLYTWTSPDGKDKEMDGFTILALVINRIALITRSTCILKSKRSRKRILSSMRTTLSYSMTAFAITSFTLIKRIHWHTLMINSSVTFSSNFEANNSCLHSVWNLSMQK